eukprot:CAMPEP_0197872246 /NCGR_PEP_ID=MMETSP1439-20131203/2406_1 /TAXON_ID=66791 /ORGANISM="Gonyaulax spinifera, Strain CCMP409" /LENGTH=154 /DNA_ID=CAMNT_0043491223 /DNA_START=65 /DNA_END=529 /DNA_ORIENTATION=-
MGKQTLRQRRRKHSKGTTKSVIKKKMAKNKSKLERRKQRRKAEKVDDLSELLAKSATVGAQPTGPSPADAAGGAAGAEDLARGGGDVDAEMPTAPSIVGAGGDASARLSREELRKRLKTKIAGGSLERTAGRTKGATDSRGQMKRMKRGGMDTS